MSKRSSRRNRRNPNTSPATHSNSSQPSPQVASPKTSPSPAASGPETKPDPRRKPLMAIAYVVLAFSVITLVAVAIFVRSNAIDGESANSRMWHIGATDPSTDPESPENSGSSENSDSTADSNLSTDVPPATDSPSTSDSQPDTAASSPDETDDLGYHDTTDNVIVKPSRPESTSESSADIGSAASVESAQDKFDQYFDELCEIRPYYFYSDATAVEISWEVLHPFVPLAPFENYGGVITSDGTIVLLGYGTVEATTALRTSYDERQVAIIVTGSDFPVEWRGRCIWVYPYTGYESYLIFDYDENSPHHLTEGGLDVSLWSYKIVDDVYANDGLVTGDQIYYLTPPNCITEIPQDPPY